MNNKVAYNISYWSEQAQLAAKRGDTVTEDFAKEQVSIWTYNPPTDFSPVVGALGSGVDTGSCQQ